MIDLHTHSTASDGSFSPSALMQEAARRSLKAIALKDHDTAAGLIEAERTAKELGIIFIPGIELEIIWPSRGEFHLLGLGLSRLSPGFIKAVEEISSRREERNLEILERMKEAGIIATYEEISSLPGEELKSEFQRSIGRPHFASFLIKRKIVRNREQAFKRYLGKGKPFYISKEGMEFEKAIEIIKESGGKAILAHPMSLYTGWGRLPDLLKSFKEKGLDGIEAWHPAAKVSSCKRLEEIGRGLGLIITAGSDFHGEASPDRKLGVTAGDRKIEDFYLEELLDELPG